MCPAWSSSCGAGIQTQILLTSEPEIFITLLYLLFKVSKVSSRRIRTLIRMLLLFKIITYFLSKRGADSFLKFVASEIPRSLY